MHYSPTPLHIPDGFLSAPVALFFWLVTAIMIALAIYKTNKTLAEKQVPLMGIMAAFIFAAQMLNFPVIAGTSGHFLGGALAAIVLGPWASILVMTAVIGLQGLLFQDGGLLAMGANIFNMGILTAVIGFGLYRMANTGNKAVKLTVAGVAAWLSTIAAALFTALQIWLSGTSRLDLVLPVMLGVHVLIGIGEAIITVAALAFIIQTRPDLLSSEKVSESGGRGWIVAGVLVALVAVLLSPLASANPDGLERVAKDMGFIGLGQSAPYRLIPNYTVPFLGQTALSTIVAGVIGALVVMGLVILLARSLRKSSDSGDN